MAGELFLLAWILDATLAGGRVNRGGERGGGDLGYNITSANTQISRRSKKS